MVLSFLILPILLTFGAAPISIPSDWVEYTPGTCNVIVSSPHGGSLKPIEIADRTHGCLGPDGDTCRWEKGCSPADQIKCRGAFGTDSYTQQVAAQVVKLLSENYNCLPHFVRSNLHRSKLDPNRPIEEAAQGDPLSQQAWRTYHDNYMATAVEAVRSRFGKGLVFDIHGQSHAEQWTEMGYLLKTQELNSGVNDLTGSSIRGLGARSRLSPSELVSGFVSFGSLFQTRGYKVVPSKGHPSPGNGSYYSGGYITQRYGSRISGEVDAIQVEIASGLRMDQTLREKFGTDLARVIDEYRLLHGYKLV